ncbi:MAG: folate-binding protein YgfZ [Proteobacteria bacterium]|nr:folate-binding protein YgfZ [Pseudomonadota bacterium]
MKFLQGQLSADLQLLTPQRALLAGFHNPQGRVIALLRLIELGPADLLALTARELAPVLVSRLGKFVLRAKVTLQDESPAWHIEGLLGNAEASSPFGIAQAGGVAREGDAHIVRIGESPSRVVSVRPVMAPASGLPTTSPRAWELAAIAAGAPQVHAATSEAFVAQMLNLDVLGGIAFDKGCYTGQEVIARAHYRGRVKRRMQRFEAADAAALSPGTTGTLGDGRSFEVVRAALRPDGRTEFLAVTALAADAAAAAPAGARTEARALPLPYALPE